MSTDVRTGDVPRTFSIFADGSLLDPPAPSSQRLRGRGDRRRMCRYAIDAAIKVNDEIALAIDLSRSGVFFESERPFRVGERVRLILPYEQPRGGAAACSAARIVRVESRGGFYGIAAAFEPATLIA